MACRRLNRAGFDRQVLDQLRRQNIVVCKDLLSASTMELLKAAGVGLPLVKDLIMKTSQICAPKVVTALQLLEQRKVNSVVFFATSLPDLDKVLHGGIPAGTLTEIAGPSACGKTQFCIMLSLLAAMPHKMGGLDGSVIYLDTEATFSAERLIEMARAKFPLYFEEEQHIVMLSQRVFIDLHPTCSSLLKRLQSLEEDIISKKVKLLIVDSVASLVRKEYGGSLDTNMGDRTNFLTKEAALLKYLAEAFSIPVVVTNQVTTRMSSGCLQDIYQQDAHTDGNSWYVTAALGNSWSHSINTRLIVQYLDNIRRQVLVAKSPIAPFTAFTYTIQTSGIVQEENGVGHYHGTDPGFQPIRVRSTLLMETSDNV